MFTSHIRERDMTYPTLLAQSGQCFDRSLEGDSIIGGVQLININSVEAQTFQTPLKRFGEMFRAGIMRPLAGAWTFPSTLGAITNPAGYG